MDVSHESAEETRGRLLRVIAQAKLEDCDESYVFEETPLGRSSPSIASGPSGSCPGRW